MTQGHKGLVIVQKPCLLFVISTPGLANHSHDSVPLIKLDNNPMQKLFSNIPQSSSVKFAFHFRKCMVQASTSGAKFLLESSSQTYAHESYSKHVITGLESSSKHTQYFAGGLVHKIVVLQNIWWTAGWRFTLEISGLAQILFLNLQACCHSS